jgi:hypothetical protein
MKKKLIIAFIFIAIIFTVCVVNAVWLNNSFFNDKSVFCVEISQDFTQGNYTEKTVTEYTTDSSLNGFQNGLGHILSYSGPRGNREYTLGGVTYYMSMNDPVQLALWAYLKENQTEARKFFGDNDLKTAYTKGGTGLERLKIDVAEGTIQRINFGFDGVPYPTTESTEAYDLYIEAKNIKNTEISRNKYKFNINYYYNSDSQTAIKVNTVEEDDTVEVELTFKKEDFDENALAGAKITIEKGNNVSSISSTSLESTGIDGIFGGTITIIPENREEPFEIKVIETQAPDDYDKINGGEEILLTVEYDENTGEVKSVVPNKESEHFELDESKTTITLKDDTVVVENDPGYTILKTDTVGNKVKDAEFELKFTNIKYVIVNENKYEEDTVSEIKTDNDGKIVINKIVAKDIGEEVTMKVTETNPAPGYIPTTDTLTLKWNYDNTNHEWKLEDLPTTPELWAVDKTAATISIANRAAVKLEFNKKDFYGDYNVEGATIKITGSENVENIAGLNAYNKITSGADGEFGEIMIYPSDETGEFKIKVEETEAPNGYQGLPETAILKVRYDINTREIISVTNETTGTTEYINDSTNKNIIIKNRAQIEKLTLLKLDSKDSNRKVAGARFTITLKNILSVGNYHVGGTDDNTEGKFIITDIETDSNGQLYIEDVVIKDPGIPVEILIEETKAPAGYKKMDGIIKLTLEREGNNYSVHAVDAEPSILETEFYTDGNLEIINHEISLGIKNIPVMNLGGIVWEDAQTGHKEVQGPDGKYNNGEQGMPGIKVELFRQGETTPVTQDIYGQSLMTKTASGGETLQYKLNNGETSSIVLEQGQYVFPNIDEGSYYIKFTYDGINYETVNLSGNVYANNDESKASEIGREGFNSKFRTIAKDTAINDFESIADIQETPLSYDKFGPSENKIYTSKLITKDEDGEVKEDFKMTANTSNYVKAGEDWRTVCWNADGTINTDSYVQDINCGLTYRKFDLALGIDVDSAKLTINGKETTYNYQQIIDGELTDLELDDLLESPSVDNDEVPTYNLYLYESDYNYRIEDYKTDIDNPAGIKDYVVKTEAERDEFAGKELKVFITYKLVLKNQTTQEGVQVNELAYYYDDNYVLKNVKDANGNTIPFASDSSLYEIDGKKSVMVSGFESDLGLDNEYRQELYFTFEIPWVDTDGDGEGDTLPDEITNPEGLECACLAEITAYSTQQGFVDNDSAPNNIMVQDGEIIFEDDTDEAKPINISINENRKRTISGTVFDDKDKDGIKDSDETVVNDVIVQLIEVKKISGKYYEYIWQETRSGSNQVKTTTRNGYAEGYNNNVTEGSGDYKFQDFIPGNYIIRFIYGDGTTVTHGMTDLMREYNGQDYKSTKDKLYDKDWYIKNKYDAGASIARDNEARRLEVMSYSTSIDGAKGFALDALGNTRVIPSNDIKVEKLTPEEKVNLLEQLKDPDITNVEALTDDALKDVIIDASENTWMCAETSRINVPVDDVENVQEQINNNPNEEHKTTKTDSNKQEVKDGLKYGDLHFGLTLRPLTKLVLEKHITGLKITTIGDGIAPIVSANLDANELLEKDLDTSKVTGRNNGLSIVKSERGNRGQWRVEADVEEIMQGSKLTVEYTYMIKNEGDKDYLTNDLVDKYKSNINDIGKYEEYLKNLGTDTVKNGIKNGTHDIGKYLGEFYYNGNTSADNLAEVPSRVDEIQEAINNELQYNEDIEANDAFEKINVATEIRNIYNTNGVPEPKNINTVIRNTSPTRSLTPKDANPDVIHDTDTADWDKKLYLIKENMASLNHEDWVYPSYIAEILKYSNAAGRRDIISAPRNLSYVHSEDSGITVQGCIYIDGEGNYQSADTFEAIPVGFQDTAVKINDNGEFWAESIKIGKATGEDKLTTLQITLITISAAAVIGAGIVLIKKFVLNK